MQSAFLAKGEAWSNIMGNYALSLQVDGSGLEVESKFSTQDPATGLSNLSGDSGKVFGFRFNSESDLGYDGLPELENTTFSQSYYQSKTFGYTVPEGGATVEFRSEAENAHVALLEISP